MSKKKQIKEPKTEVVSSDKDERQPVLRIIDGVLVMTLVVIWVIILSDLLGLFRSDAANNHAQKKWDAFYGFSKGLNVDVLLLGNSHMYTGINPETFCTAMGVNAFILATPGTSVADSYFGLKEALKRCKPGLVVLETYGINDFDPYHPTPENLAEQINSFSARNDFFIKLVSTPQLFPVRHYLEAWSPTIRNHHYIFSKPEVIGKNFSLLFHSAPRSTELNLGRFVRFTTGLKQTTLERYDKDGAPVDGADYSYSKYAPQYVDKIIKLCEQNHITLMFLTLPMYSKHVKNYPAWKARLGEILNRYPNKWLDLQETANENDFTPECFEDTRNKNQHMTFLGSLMATYKLCDFLNSTVHPVLPDRREEKKWLALFYGKDSYFENNLPLAADPNVKRVATDKAFKTIMISELLQVRKTKGVMTLIAKVKKDLIPKGAAHNMKLKLLLTYTDSKKKSRKLSAVLPYDVFQETPQWAIFKLNISPVNVTSVEDCELEHP